MTNITKDECAKYSTLHSEPFPYEKLRNISFDFDLWAKIKKGEKEKKTKENKTKNKKTTEPFEY